MKKRLYLYVLILIMTIHLISSAHIVTTSNGGTSYSTNKGVAFLYNITINNTDTGQNSKITQVNITLPTNLKFKAGTQGTNSPYEAFSNTSNTLTWQSSNVLINSSEVRFFEFIANASISGSYIITITTLNSTAQYFSNISVDITSIGCVQDWSCTDWSLCINKTKKRECTDLNMCGNKTGKPLEKKYCIPTTTLCTPNWTCTNWSECIGEKKIRTCVDVNLCGDDSEKPIETQTCSIGCTSVWRCTDWQPKKCQEKDETQTRTCTDLNNCEEKQNKPNETRLCGFNTNPILFFTILVVIIITAIIIISITLMQINKESINKNSEKSPSIAL